MSKEKKCQKCTDSHCGYTVLATVPYQCCPVCGGTRQTIADGFTSSVYQACKVCNGACVIPQHIVQQALDIDS